MNRSNKKHEKTLEVGQMVLTDLDKYPDEWPQMGEIKYVNDRSVTICWYKGSKTTAWTKCTIPMPGQRGRRIHWEEEINKNDIWLSGFRLTNNKCLPKSVREAIDNYH